MLNCQHLTFTDCSLPTLCDLRMSITLLDREMQAKADVRRHVWEADSPDNIGRPVRHWSNADSCDDLSFLPPSLRDDSTFHCIIAADVLYFESQVHPLIHTLERRLKGGGFALFLVTVRNRTTATSRAFEDALVCAGFQVSGSDAALLPSDMTYLTTDSQLPTHYTDIFASASNSCTSAAVTVGGVPPICDALAGQASPAQFLEEQAGASDKSMGEDVAAAGTQFTCCTGTKVQILTCFWRQQRCRGAL